MIKIFPDTRIASSETTVNIHLGTNDIFNCLNVLLRDWEYLRPEQKEIVSDFVDEFIIKIIDDDI